MAPLRLSYIWYRRLYVALFIMSLGYIVLYFLQPLASTAELFTSLSIDLVAVILSTITVITCVVLYALGKRISSFMPALAVFAVFVLTTAYLITSGSNELTTFLAPWAFISLSAALFGAYGWLPVLALTGSYLAGEYLSNNLAGEQLIMIISGSIIPLIVGIIVWHEAPISSDNTDKNVKNLANQLSEVAQKSEIIINAIGDGVMAINGKGIVELINPAAQEMLGWGKQDALVLNYKSILKLTDEATGKEVDPSHDPIQQVLNTNQQTRGNKLIATTKSGKKLGIAIVASPIGEPGSGAIAVFRDVTNERAEERQQAEFISTASHEMRTPVASIEGYLGLALNSNTATIDERARGFILKAHEAAQHLGRLFQDLLDVSKSEDGRLQNNPRVIDIVPYTDTIVQGLQQKAAEKGLTLTFVPTSGSNQKKIMPVYYVNLDNDHIREVLDNLIENAIKYTPQGQVTVDITGADDKVVVSIKDTGLGIPAEDIPHLFQKFYRVENVDRQTIGGTGLGLYLCRRLVEAMQGRLWVESVFGNGSTFFVELPRIDSQQAEMLKQQQAMQFIQPASKQISVTIAPEDTPVPAEAPTPAVVASSLNQTPPTQTTPQQTAAPTVLPATTVPRGESLTREQINERVRQLEALAAQQRGSVTPPPRQ